MAKRFDVLDALRGLAALEVLIHHCFIAFPVFWAANFLAPLSPGAAWLLSYTPLHLLWSGQEAVIFFFCLSGFVLALPYVDGRAPLYGPYLIRRFCRIYLPFAGVALLSLLLLKAGVGRAAIPGASPALNCFFSRPIGARELADIFLMTGDMHWLVPTAWSLVHEIRLSILFPLVGMAVTGLRGREAFGLGCLLALWGGAWSARGVTGWLDLNLTVFYSAFFVWGALLARYRGEVSAWVGDLSRGWRAAMILAALGLYGFRWIFEGPGLAPPLDTYLSQTLVGAGALMLMMLTLGLGAWTRFLGRPGFLWLGHVSYSLYLVHPLVLFVTVYYLWPALSLAGSVVLGFLLSVFFAALYGKWVEQPSIRWGRRLSREGRS